jgi:hypothetical protein
VSYAGIFVLCAVSLSCTKARVPAVVRDSEGVAAVGEIRVGGDYERAMEALKLAGANDWTRSCGYLVVQMDPDRECKTSYHTLSDGFNFTLRGSRPKGRRAGKNPRWAVGGMSVSDSAYLRGGKAETDYPLTRIVFRHGRSRPEGLPTTALYLNLDRSEAARRMKRYGWKRKAYDPSVKAPPRAKHSADRAASAAGSWELHELDGTELYLKFLSSGDGETLDEIRDGGGLAFEVFDQHLLTVKRCRAVIEAALPKGWSARPERNCYTGDDLGILIQKAAPPDRGGGLMVRILHPMTAGEFRKCRAELPKLNARRDELEKAAEAFTEGGTVTVRTDEQQRIMLELCVLNGRMLDVPDFRTSKAAILAPELSDSTPKELHGVIEAVGTALRICIDHLPGDRRTHGRGGSTCRNRNILRAHRSTAGSRCVPGRCGAHLR